MEKAIFESMGGSYMEVNGFLIPCLLSASDGHQQPVGIWGQRHLRSLEQYRRATYISLKTTGKLNGYLVDIDRQAEEMFTRLVQQMAEQEGVTEELKAADPMEWVQRMNGIKSRATEIVNTDLINI